VVVALTGRAGFNGRFRSVDSDDDLSCLSIKQRNTGIVVS
jgi:hypothetical protein